MFERGRFGLFGCEFVNACGCKGIGKNKYVSKQKAEIPRTIGHELSTGKEVITMVSWLCGGKIPASRSWILATLEFTPLSCSGPGNCRNICGVSRNFAELIPKWIHKRSADNIRSKSRSLVPTKCLAGKTENDFVENRLCSGRQFCHSETWAFGFIIAYLDEGKNKS